MLIMWGGGGGATKTTIITILHISDKDKSMKNTLNLHNTG